MAGLSAALACTARNWLNRRFSTLELGQSSESEFDLPRGPEFDFRHCLLAKVNARRCGGLDGLLGCRSDLLDGIDAFRRVSWAPMFSAEFRPRYERCHAFV